MYRSNSLSLRTLALAGAVLVMAALPAFADRGGRGGGGRGGYSGGGRGGYDGGYRGGYGGYRGGDFGRGFYPGIGIGFGLGYGSGYGSGYRYSGYGYDSPYYGNSVIIGSSPYVSGYYSPPDVTVVQPSTVIQSNYDTPVAADTTATLKVMVPADAQVWFDGNATSQTGEVRTYGTPPLDPNKAFHYDIRARWSENGRVVDQTRRVEVRAGLRQDVDFMRGESIGAPVKP